MSKRCSGQWAIGLNSRKSNMEPNQRLASHSVPNSHSFCAVASNFVDTTTSAVFMGIRIWSALVFQQSIKIGQIKVIKANANWSMSRFAQEISPSRGKCVNVLDLHCPFCAFNWSRTRDILRITTTQPDDKTRKNGYLEFLYSLSASHPQLLRWIAKLLSPF